MEIGPISGIRPVAMVKPGTQSADLTKVVSAELRDQRREGDEAGNGKANRGLEEDDAENGAIEEAEPSGAGSASDGTISFFA